MPRVGGDEPCYVQFLTRRRVENLRREGIPDAENIQNGRAVGRVPIKETAPKEKMRSHVNKRTGTTHTVPEGIDPGFEWNPGEARARGLSKALVERRNGSISPFNRRRLRAPRFRRRFAVWPRRTPSRYSGR